MQRFSIIIPVFNVESFLKVCLDSISYQTFQEFEVICVNDGSTDNSLSILEDYSCRNGSAVSSISDDNFGVFQNIELLKEYLIKNNLYSELKDEFKDYQVMVMSWHYKYISTSKIEEYCAKCREYLTNEEYKKMLYQVKHHDNSFLEFIFSLKNEQEFGIKRKVITILGIRIKIKQKQKRWGGNK